MSTCQFAANSFSYPHTCTHYSHTLLDEYLQLGEEQGPGNGRLLAVAKGKVHPVLTVIEIMQGCAILLEARVEEEWYDGTVF